MTPEERLQYNKTYYAQNKTKLLKIQSEKVECSLCHRCVSLSSLKTHQKTKLCKKYSELIFITK